MKLERPRKHPCHCDDCDQMSWANPCRNDACRERVREHVRRYNAWLVETGSSQEPAVVVCSQELPNSTNRTMAEATALSSQNDSLSSIAERDTISEDVGDPPAVRTAAQATFDTELRSPAKEAVPGSQDLQVALKNLEQHDVSLTEDQPSEMPAVDLSESQWLELFWDRKISTDVRPADYVIPEDLIRELDQKERNYWSLIYNMLSKMQLKMNDITVNLITSTLKEHGYQNFRKVILKILELLSRKDLVNGFLATENVALKPHLEGFKKQYAVVEASEAGDLDSDQDEPLVRQHTLYVDPAGRAGLESSNDAGADKLAQADYDFLLYSDFQQALTQVVGIEEDLVPEQQDALQFLESRGWDFDLAVSDYATWLFSE